MLRFEGHPDMQVPEKINTIQIEGSVVLSIVRHCHGALPAPGTGSLLGLDVEDRVEVASCFPHPLDASAEAEGIDPSEYQLDMMKALRSVGIDSNNVGWYNSVFFNSYFYGDEISFAQAWAKIVEGQYAYQSSIPNSVVLLYDPMVASRGEFSLRAFRLSASFMKVYAKCALKGERLPSITKEDFSAFDISSSDIFDEIPVKIHNSLLVHAFLYELREKKQFVSDSRLEFHGEEVLKKSMDRLGQVIDEFVSEQNGYLYHQREAQRRIQRQEAFLTKSGIEKGSAEYDDLLSRHHLFRPVASPDRVTTLLVNRQMRELVNTIESTSEQEMIKLQCLKGLYGEQ